MTIDESLRDVIMKLDFVLDNGKSKFYRIGYFYKTGKKGIAGDVQLEVENGNAKAFRVATTHGSGRYSNNLRDALAIMTRLGYRFKSSVDITEFYEIDDTMQENWKNGLFGKW